MLEIIREQGGGPIPGAAEVAERAGVSERTVFRHFADLDSLFIAAASKQRPILLAYLGPRPDMKELDKRITAVVRLRSKMYEEISSVRRVAMRLLPINELLASAMKEANRVARSQLADVFANELKQAGKDKAMLLDQLELITSWAAWEALRTEIGASPERARRITTDLLTATLSRFSRRRASR